MLTDGEDKKQKPVGHAEIRQDGYLYVDDSINFFTGELQVNGRQQSFVLGVPVKYETDTNGRKYAIAIQRPDPLEIRKFLFDISDTTTIEMSIDGNDNDERYATYFYYGANGMCQHSAFSDKSGHNVMIESDYDMKGRVIKYCHHGENWIACLSSAKISCNCDIHCIFLAYKIILFIYISLCKPFILLPNHPC